MDFQHSERSRELQARVGEFMRRHVEPVEHLYYDQVQAAAQRYRTPPVLQELKALARQQGLWNLFLSGEHGSGLTNLEYAPVKEIMGRVLWAPEVFNCSAPDTGNMEVLAHYGTPEQQERWLRPLLDGRIRSGFSMTEPAVASSDATNIQCEIRRDGDHYVINGRKWFTSGAMNEDCELLIVMGKTDPNHPDRHRQQSMILVPRDTPGVRIVRDILTFGYDDAPVGHPEIVYDNVRVPAANILLGEGRGFEIAQGRLGPGRIHHCMRLIGCAQRALELMCARATSRVAFGKPLAEQGSVREDIAHSFCDIAQARLLTLQAADKMDREGNKAARDLIAAAKIVVPSMAARVIDRAIQVHGGAGVSQDTFLPRAYVYARFIRIGDGPDQVHLAAIGKDLIKRGGTAA
ncbi:MAG: acyl-CoA dehydrogenase family protein [Xanthobacteraceae bacterium]|nr:acyl-CoA dehydrogenase family protein [Xanthobacteraceae bacterium]